MQIAVTAIIIGPLTTPIDTELTISARKKAARALST